jgi:hypothetical protein
VIEVFIRIGVGSVEVVSSATSLRSKTMRKKIAIALTAGVAAATVGFGATGTASAAPRDGKCVAANLSALPGSAKSGVAKSDPGALAGVIQLHLDRELDLGGFCGLPDES